MLVLIPILLGTALSFFVGIPSSELVLFAVSFSIAAVVLLFWAKLPILRTGRFFTFGPGELPKQRRPWYFVSYGMLFIALCA